jgi:hypothetical protein
MHRSSSQKSGLTTLVGGLTAWRRMPIFEAHFLNKNGMIRPRWGPPMRCCQSVSRWQHLREHAQEGLTGHWKTTGRLSAASNRAYRASRPTGRSPTGGFTEPTAEGANRAGEMLFKQPSVCILAKTGRDHEPGIVFLTAHRMCCQPGRVPHRALCKVTGPSTKPGAQ